MNESNECEIASANFLSLRLLTVDRSEESLPIRWAKLHTGTVYASREFRPNLQNCTGQVAMFVRSCEARGWLQQNIFLRIIQVSINLCSQSCARSDGVLRTFTEARAGSLKVMPALINNNPLYCVLRRLS